jgi:hypothetical protein
LLSLINAPADSIKNYNPPSTSSSIDNNLKGSDQEPTSDTNVTTLPTISISTPSNVVNNLPTTESLTPPIPSTVSPIKLKLKDKKVFLASSLSSTSTPLSDSSKNEPTIPPLKISNKMNTFKDNSSPKTATATTTTSKKTEKTTATIINEKCISVIGITPINVIHSDEENDDVNVDDDIIDGDGEDDIIIGDIDQQIVVNTKNNTNESFQYIDDNAVDGSIDDLTVTNKPSTSLSSVNRFPTNFNNQNQSESLIWKPVFNTTNFSESSNSPIGQSDAKILKSGQSKFSTPALASFTTQPISVETIEPSNKA